MAFAHNDLFARHGRIITWTLFLLVTSATLAGAAIAADPFSATPAATDTATPDPVHIELRPPQDLHPHAVTHPLGDSASTADILKTLADEHRCLAEVMYYEARGEGENGQRAVGEVIFNRLAAGDHGNTICAVVYEGVGQTFCQFTFACDGSLQKPKEPEPWRLAQVLAARMLIGEMPGGDMVDGATAYHAISVHPHWGVALREVARVGDHIFYRPANGAVLADGFRGSLN